MSRTDFRVAVHEPRPPSAWVMVTVASATLWITEQLEPWAIAAQTAAILLSLWRRKNPFAWQSNPWLLNVGMIAIVTGTIAVALGGGPSTIALANFAASTQGLQLIDARPRRTEFLLVVLALFQVVLAANLTDSVFFTPLLVLFVFATVWTLVVHTLRSEALEAGQSAELSRAFTPGLLRTTLWASALSVILAMLLFVMLPRLRSSVVQGPVGGPSVATAGFSDRVEFGALGRIRQDPRVVLRVETLEGDPVPITEAYYRGLAFDHFDGKSWSITPPNRTRVPGTAEGGVSLGPTPETVDLVQRIVREPVEAGVLFRVGEPRGVQGTIRRLERDVSGGLYAANQSQSRVRYTVRSWRTRPSLDALREDRAVAPRGRAARLLSLPPLAPEVEALARRIVAEAATDADRARAIESYLVREGLYTDDPPESQPERQDDPRSPVERFLLGELAGHCEYFASGMVLLARELELPARLVNGFAGGRTNAIGGFVELTQSDAHAWVEIHYADAGWVRYDPTPPDLRAAPIAELSLRERMRDLASAMELWWFQRVVGFDRSDQMNAMRRAWLAWRARSKDGSRPKARAKGQANAWRDVFERREGLVAAGALAGILACGVWLWRRRQRQHRGPHARYERALRLLARRGVVRAPEQSARAYAETVTVAFPREVADAFARLTEEYLAERFGERPDAAADTLQRFEAALGQAPRTARSTNAPRAS
ncbi:MAG: DUF3488 and transglutaminase-like domain-containing protein [Myxococcota bacterium]